MDSHTEGMARALESAPPGTFKLFRGSGTGVEDTIQTHLENLGNISQRIERANAAGCFVEVISLRLQIMDFWLRVYFVNCASEGAQRQREFGRLLDQCKELGFDRALYARLREFNQHRVNAIHGYVVGRTTYDQLESVVAESRAHSADLIEFVITHAGQGITRLDGYFHVGDMVLNIPLQIQHLRQIRSL